MGSSERPTIYRQIKVFEDNYVYFIHDPSTKGTAVVDPGDAEPVLEALQSWGWDLSACLLTHHHEDHIGGAEAVRSHTGCLIVGSCEGKGRLPSLDVEINPGEEGSYPNGKGMKNFRVLGLEGHTRDHIGFFFDDDSSVFVGDTIFAAGCGRLFEGTPAQMWASMQRLQQLPRDTMVFCGHEYTLTNLRFARAVDPNNQALLDREKECRALREQGKPTVPFSLATEHATNPFFRCNDPVAVDQLVDPETGSSLCCDVKAHKPEDVFARLRGLKDRF